MIPTVEYMEITPQMAREMLGKSKGNPRWTSGKLVNIENAKRIAADIVNGDWHLGSGDIIFDEDGVLVDGHTRLTAITLANKAVPCFVKRGITEEGKRHIDDNKVRGDSQRLHVPQMILATASIQRYMLGGVSPRAATQLTTEQKRRWIEVHPSAVDMYNIVQKSNGGKRITKNAACAHAALCAFEYGVSGTKLTQFFTKTNNGYVDSADESACITARNFLLNTNFLGGNAAISAHASVVLQEAIYDFCRGMPRTKPYRLTKTEGRYFAMNAARGDKRYLSMWGE